MPVILLTATINPNNMAFTVLSDPTVREKQYRESLWFYLKNTNHKIVFCENSAYDFNTEEYDEYVQNERLEILSFDGNNFDRNLGKGLGEANIIEYALINSLFLSQEKRFVKISGRHIIKNIVQLTDDYLNGVTPDSLLLRIGLRKAHVIQSEIVGAEKIFWLKYFLPHKGELNDTKAFYFEHLLYQATKHWFRNGNKVNLFKYPIEDYTVSGSTGEYELDKWIKLPKFCFSLRIFIIQFLINHWGLIS